MGYLTVFISNTFQNACVRAEGFDSDPSVCPVTEADERPQAASRAGRKAARVAGLLRVGGGVR